MHVTQCLLQETLASRWENTSKPFIANKVCKVYKVFIPEKNATSTTDRATSLLVRLKTM